MDSRELLEAVGVAVGTGATVAGVLGALVRAWLKPWVEALVEEKVDEERQARQEAVARLGAEHDRCREQVDCRAERSEERVLAAIAALSTRIDQALLAITGHQR